MNVNTVQLYDTKLQEVHLPWTITNTRGNLFGATCTIQTTVPTLLLISSRIVKSNSAVTSPQTHIKHWIKIKFEI